MSIVDIAFKIKVKNGILQAFADERGWTQSEFARRVGVDVAEAGRWFNMTGFPRTPEKMLRVIALVGKPAEDIFPPLLMEKDWLTGARKWTIHKEIDSECLPIHHMTALPAPKSEIDSFDLKENINAVLQTLTRREEKVIRMRLGLDGEDEHTLEEVGEVFGLTRDRIHQIEAKAIRKLRHPSRRHMVEGYLDSV